jgi:hypothetical protein
MRDRKNIEIAGRMEDVEARRAKFKEVERATDDKERNASAWVGKMLSEAEKQQRVGNTAGRPD